MKNIICLLSITIIVLLSGCADQDNFPKHKKDFDERTVTVRAAMPSDNSSTRISLHESEGSLTLSPKWDADDVIKLIFVQDDIKVIGESAKVYNISEDGKQCSFDLTLPEDIEISKPFTLYTFADIPGFGVKIENGEILADISPIRMKSIEEMPVPVWSKTDISSFVSDQINLTYINLGAYEVIQIKNSSDSDLNLSTCQLVPHNESSALWYYSESESTKPVFNPETGEVTDYDNNNSSAGSSITIESGETETILSWYVPNSENIPELSLQLDNKTSYKSKEGKDFAMQAGRAYYIYAVWDGYKLTIKNTHSQEENLLTETITPDGGIVRGPDGIEVVFPPNSVNSNVTLTVGYTGNEPTNFGSNYFTTVGKPFTIIMDYSTLSKEGMIIVVDAPNDFDPDHTIAICSANPLLPLNFNFNSITNKVEIFMDIVDEAVFNRLEAYSAFVYSFILNKQLANQEEIGFRQVNITNNRVSLRPLSNIEANENILLLIHGWTSAPTSCWSDFVKKIYPQIKQSNYTKIITFGYYSGLAINTNGQHLSSFLNNLPSEVKVDIVAHSMGGLVARSALENHNASSHVKNLITLGTPHKGSIVAHLRNFIGWHIKYAYKNSPSLIGSFNTGSLGFNDLTDTSQFITSLNRNSKPANLNYYPIAAVYIENQNYISLQGLQISTINQELMYNGILQKVLFGSDGVVARSSALGIQGNNSLTIGATFEIFSVMPHLEITDDDAVIVHVAEKLNSYNVETTVPVTGITVTPTSKTLNIGESFSITANVNPSNATNKKVTWRTSSAGVATVDANGRVTAKGWGNATISAVSEDGNKTASCAVIVKVPGLILSTETVNLKVDETATVSITSGSGNYKAISNNPSVVTATVSANTITIKGVAAGSGRVQVNDDTSQQIKYINVVVTRDSDPGTGGVSELEGENM